MSRDLRSIVAHQLRALGNGEFEVGVQDLESGQMRLRTVSSEQILQSLDFLRAQNRAHHFVRLRPLWPHPFVLVDDVQLGHVQTLDDAGLSASVVLESSPGNFQVWLRLGRVVSQTAMTLVARELASLLDGDRGAANWRQAGALAGFTNCKVRHRDAAGRYPMVQLHLAKERVFLRAEELATAAEHAEAAQRRRWAELRAVYARTRSDEVKPIASFHDHPRYSGDLHRADLAWAIHALSGGLGSDEVAYTILMARDLEHKGSRREQERYAARTVRAAYEKGLGRRATTGPTLSKCARGGAR